LVKSSYRLYFILVFILYFIFARHREIESRHRGFGDLTDTLSV
jgi:hypothetical protein